MAYTDWNSSISKVLRRIDVLSAGTATLGSNTTPTSGHAVTVWKGVHAHVEGRLLACGVTITSSGSDWDYASELEAMLVGAAVGQIAEMKVGGQVSDTTRELKKVGAEWLSAVCANPGIMSSLGATVVHTVGVYPSALALDNPDPNFDDTKVLERDQCDLYDVEGDL